MGAPSDLKSFEKGYIKFQQRGKKNLPLGFLVPYDPEKGSSRKGTVDSWAKGIGQGDEDLKDMAFVLDNIPKEGFKILGNVRRYRTENVIWRVEDPRGFQLEITSENLNYLLDHVSITDRTLSDDLVWTTTHSGGRLWLVPKDSEAFEKAKTYLSCRDKRISLRDVNRGDIVQLHDGRVVRYLGGMYGPKFTKELNPDHRDYGLGSSSQNRYISLLSIVRHYAFEVLDADDQLMNSWGSSKGLDTKSSIKVGKILEENDSPLTGKEAEEIANKLVSDRQYWHGHEFFRSKKFTEDDLEFKDEGRIGVVDGTDEYQVRNPESVPPKWKYGNA